MMDAPDRPPHLATTLLATLTRACTTARVPTPIQDIGDLVRRVTADGRRDGTLPSWRDQVPAPAYPRAFCEWPPSNTLIQMSGLGGLDPIRSLAGGHALSAVLRAAAQPKPHNVIAAGIASPRAQRRQVLRVEREAPWRTMQTAFVAPPPPWLAQIAPLADWAHQWGNPCDGVLAVICRGRYGLCART